MYAVIMADRDVQDVQPFLLSSCHEANQQQIPLTDRDGNAYVGRLVFHADTYTAVSHYVTEAHRSGQLPDGTPTPQHSLLIAELATRPWGDAPLKFT
jgi:hypothetical protein